MNPSLILQARLSSSGSSAWAGKQSAGRKGGSSAAFTLVELLVSVGIFTTITTLAVFNHGQFNGSVLLTNLAYEIALSVRQAQFYGITVKRSSANTFDSGYGVNFNMTTPTAYTLFEDKTPVNHVYSAGEAVENFTLRKGNRISKICLTSSGSCQSVTSVDISFVRPNPDSFILSGGTSYSKAEICVSSPLGTERKIIVDATGQISVAAADSACD